MKYLIISLFLLILSGCAGSLSMISSAIGSADFFTRLFTDKGVVDHAISEGQGKNCKIFKWTENGNVICEGYKKND